MLATGADEKAHLRLGPFGDDLQPEFVREPDGGVHHGDVAVIDRHAEHEFVRKLQPVHRLGGQIFERRIASRNRGAKQAKILQRVAVLLRRLHQHRLGALELESRRVEAQARQARLDLALELGGALGLSLALCLRRDCDR